MNASRALLDFDVDAVRQFCRTMFDVDPGEDTATRLCVAWKKHHGGKWHTSAGPAMWVKNRLREWEEWPTAGHEGCGDVRLEAILHVFFLFLKETQEMLANLPEGAKATPKVARSKISKTQELIQPIDRVAHDVTDWKT